jgi:hypothetical protein
VSTPDISKIFSVPGRLSHSPTSLSTAYPHGGTAIGSVGKFTPYPRDPSFPLRAVEWGNAVYDVVEGGHDWVFTAELREVLDADALAAIFPCYAAGASGGPILTVRAGTDSQRAGVVLGASFSRVVLFTPTAEDDHPWLIIRRAVPAIQATAELALRGNDELRWPVMWYATPDSNKAVLDFGLRRDLTL